MAWIRIGGGGKPKPKIRYEIIGGGWVGIKRYDNDVLTVDQFIRGDDKSNGAELYNDTYILVNMIIGSVPTTGELYGQKITSKVPMYVNGEKVSAGSINYASGTRSLILEIY